MTCVVPGCRRAIYRRDGRDRPLCRAHRYIVKSGRVNGDNFYRDLHNAHRGARCECCGVTTMQLFEKFVKPWMLRMCPGELTHLRRRDKIKLGVQHLNGDHVKGRQRRGADSSTNIQTLCLHCHKSKTIACKEHTPLKYRR